MFLLVPAHPGSPRQRAVKRLLSVVVCEIFPDPLIGFARNSHGRRVWCLARTSLKVKVTRDKTAF